VKTQKEGGFIDWNNEFLIPCQLPIMSSRIVMKLFDEDKISDEIVGSLLFNLKECIGKKKGTYFWKNIYGAPLNYSGDNANKMNETPEVASCWKGRILMGVDAEKTEKPQLLMQDIAEEEVAKAQKYAEEKEYEFIAEVGQGIALPWEEKFQVQIQIAEYEFNTPKATVQEKNYNRWNHRFEQQTMKLPYLDEYDIGRVYIYIMSGDKQICFYQAEVEDFLDPNPEMIWLQMKCDLAVGKVTEAHKAGVISLKLSIHNKSKNGPIDFSKFEAWKKPPPKRLNVFKVRCYLFQCRDLPAADDDGQSDPFITIWDQSKEVV